MKLILSLSILLMASVTLAMPTVLVKGVVVAFDQKMITLKQKHTKVYVPRKSYPDLKKVTVGRTWITVEVTPKEMLDLNPINRDKKPAPRARVDTDESVN